MAPPEPSSEKFHGFDLREAIAARRMIRFEQHPFLRVHDEVYATSDDILRDFAQNQHSLLTAIASDYISPPNWQGRYKNVDVVLPNGILHYIGCVLDRPLTEDMRRFRLSNQRLVLKHDQIRQEDVLTIRREAWICAIPTMSEDLPSVILTDAIRRYFARFVPLLGSVPLEWLNDKHPELAHEIESRISQEAGRLTDPKHGLSTLKYEQVIERLLSDRDKE